MTLVLLYTGFIIAIIEEPVLQSVDFQRRTKNVIMALLKACHIQHTLQYRLLHIPEVDGKGSTFGVNEDVAVFIGAGIIPVYVLHNTPPTIKITHNGSLP